MSLHVESGKCYNECMRWTIPLVFDLKLSEFFLSVRMAWRQIMIEIRYTELHDYIYACMYSLHVELRNAIEHVALFFDVHLSMHVQLYRVNVNVNFIRDLESTVYDMYLSNRFV